MGGGGGGGRGETETGLKGCRKLVAIFLASNGAHVHRKAALVYSFLFADEDARQSHLPNFSFLTEHSAVSGLHCDYAYP